MNPARRQTMNSPLPKISIVTVAYNMERFIEQTIRSVTDYKTPEIEYILVDGLSDDATLSIAKQYSDYIDILISEPDDGQYQAIAKGFSRSSGEIMGWINADDILMPWTFSVVAQIFDQFPEVDWITGLPSFLNEAGMLGRVQWDLPAYPRNFIANGWYQRYLAGYLQQESMFWRRSLWDRVGGLETRHSLAADFDLWTRFASHADLIPVDVPLAAFRERPDARSAAGAAKYEAEVAAICAAKPRAPALWRLVAALGLGPRAAARLLIQRSGAAIIYDRNQQAWTKVCRSRSISRQSLSMLIDEWRMRRANQGEASRC
jgi:hypothetical protein